MATDTFLADSKSLLCQMNIVHHHNLLFHFLFLIEGVMTDHRTKAYFKFHVVKLRWMKNELEQFTLTENI